MHRNSVTLLCLLGIGVGIASARVLAYFPFDDDTSPPLTWDCSPNGYVLPSLASTVNGAVLEPNPPNTAGVGRTPSGALFIPDTDNENDEYLDIPGLSLNLPGDPDLGSLKPIISFSVWLYPTPAGNQNAGSNWVFDLIGRLEFYIKKDNDEFTIRVMSGTSHSTQLPELIPDEWQLVACTYNTIERSVQFWTGSSNNPSADNIATTSTTFSQGVLFDGSTAQLFVGNRAEQTPTRAWPGFIDELVFYDSPIDDAFFSLLYVDQLPPRLTITTVDNVTTSGPDTQGRFTYSPRLLEQVNFDANAPCGLWQARPISVCYPFTEAKTTAFPSTTYSLVGKEPEIAWIEGCRVGMLNNHQDFRFTEWFAAKLDVLNTPPFISPTLLPPVSRVPPDADWNITFDDEDVITFPFGSEGYSWEIYAPVTTGNETNSTRRGWGEGWRDKGSCESGRQYCRVFDEQAYERGGVNLTWQPLPGATERALSFYTSDLNGSDVRVRVTNYLGSSWSNSTTILIDNSIGDGVDGDGGGDGDGTITAAIGASVGGGVLLVCCCLLLFAGALVLVALIAAAAGVGGAGLFVRRTKLSLAGKYATSAASELRDMWKVPYEELEVGRALGTGAFGTVYLGTWRGTAVAIKQLQLAEGQMDAFLAEADVMRGLRPHPSVVQLYGVCTEPTSPLCIIMEYLKVGDLLHFLRAKGPPPLELAAQMAYNVASGMDHLAREGIIHRDLAARNLLLTETLHVKVADFGMSQLQVADDKEVKETLVGPIRWIAPEVLRRIAPFSQKTDVYAYAITLYEIYSGGRQPYEGMSVVEAARAVVGENLRPSFPEGTPSYVLEITDRCWHADPTIRPTFKQIAKMLLSSCDVLDKTGSATFDFHSDLGSQYAALMDMTSECYLAIEPEEYRVAYDSLQ